jgi:hypothetical protein
MVPVVRVSHGFEARVVAAKLGSEGIVTQFRGAVEGPYPVGAVDVLVPEDDVAEARVILATDEEVSAPATFDPGEGRLAERTSKTPVVLLALTLVLVALALATASGAGFGR